MKGNHSYLSKTCTILVLSSIITVSISGCGLFKKDKEVLAPPLVKSSVVDLKTGKAEIKNIEKTIALSSVCVPKDTFICTFSQRGGFIKSLNFKSGDSVKKGDVLAELDNNEISSEVEEQSLVLKKLQLRYQSLLEDPNVQNIEKQTLELDVQAQESRLQRLKTEEKKHKLTSPVDGYVVSKADLSIGDRVNGSDPIYTVAKSNSFKFLCDQSQDAGSIAIGMSTIVQFNGKDLSGKVTSLDEKFYRDGKTTKCIAIETEGNLAGAKMGQTFSTFISVGKKENALVVPRKAVKYYDSKAYVRILENGSRIERFVEVGLINSAEAEITSGLQEGDEVIIN